VDVELGAQVGDVTRAKDEGVGILGTLAMYLDICTVLAG